MDRRDGSIGVMGEDSRQEDLHGTEQDVAHEGSTPRVSNSSTENLNIGRVEELRDAIRLNNLSQVVDIRLRTVDIGSEYSTLAEALASGQMSALRTLRLNNIGLCDERAEAVGTAVALGNLGPSLRLLSYDSNMIGTKGVEALGRAIRYGSLENLDALYLDDTGINDDGMATLTAAFQHGEASVLPKLDFLSLGDNAFTDVGVRSLAEALKSGRLDSLERLYLVGFHNIGEDGLNALLSAFTKNKRLTTDVIISSEFADLERRLDRLQERNRRHERILEILEKTPNIQATLGKVYLCGSPEVGKTTLSRTLKRSWWQSLWMWERRPHREKRTRGIDVSELSSKGTNSKAENRITLLVWDMAGQQDYHLVHNSFFPDLSSSQGQATTFVIVCNSKDVAKAKGQLGYWLRYIASSCHKTTEPQGTRPQDRRHVFVVLNKVRGDKNMQGYAEWTQFVEDQRVKFAAFLDVHQDPFILDARRRQKVNPLKMRLFEHSRKVLEAEEVPEICNLIQSSLTIWSEARKDFPVLDWEAFLEEVEGTGESNWDEGIISSAAKYLNESGVVIFIDKEFPAQWGIPYRPLVVLNPNWLCKAVIGNIFVSENMVGQRERLDIMRNKVDKITGSISISEFQKTLKFRWSDQDLQDLIVILLWLGLCYKGEEKLIIPALIHETGNPGDLWSAQSAHSHGEKQWVMGFSIQHKETELCLAPMSLWHRFQVELAQTPKFNGEVPDNNFVAGKYFVKFAVDYMDVLIEVETKEDIPTFDEISIFVKPKFRENDILDEIERKQCQVNLADNLAEILLGLWDDICAGVQYVQKVVWPWPVSSSRLVVDAYKNVEVAEVRKWVRMRGMGRPMQWTVGLGSTITEDQLLSTKDKADLIDNRVHGLRQEIKAVESDISILKEAMREAVTLKIYPSELTKESDVGLHGIEVGTSPTSVSTQEVSSEKSRVATDGSTGDTRKILEAAKVLEGEVREIKKELRKEATLIRREVREEARETRRVFGDKMENIYKKLCVVEKKLQEGLATVVKEQRQVFQKLQDTARFFKENQNRTCPNLIYLGERDSGAWATLNRSLSPIVKVKLQFACEAMYNTYKPHKVTDQRGVDVSELKEPLKKIAPWLKVSLTILLTSAKIATNIVAPGAGFILPDPTMLQQSISLFDGIVSTTGFSMSDLDKLTADNLGLHPDDPLWNPKNVYGKSRAAITNLIGNLTPRDYNEQFGLRKVSLEFSDGSLHGIVWICNDCHKKFKESAVLVTDLQ